MEERKTVRKWFWVWDFEKEERWLNEMAMAGWVLDGVGYATYHFVRCEPGEYVIRLEMHPAEPGYREFMEETGAEYISRLFGWVYWRRKAPSTSFPTSTPASGIWIGSARRWPPSAEPIWGWES